MTSVPLPDPAEFLTSVQDSPALNAAHLAWTMDKLGPDALAALTLAALGSSVRHSVTIEDNELGNSRTRSAWGFCRLNSDGYWTLVRHFDDMNALARQRLTELLSDPFVCRYLSTRVHDRAFKSLPVYNTRQGLIVSMWMEFKRNCATISDAERRAWLVDFLDGNFSGTVRASHVSQALKNFGHPYAFDGGEVREVVRELLDRGERPLPIVKGYEVIPLGDISDLLHTWADNAPRT